MMFDERQRGGRKTFKLSFLGYPVLETETTTQPFDIKRLPRYVEGEVRRKLIPPALVQDSLAIIGRAYSDAGKLWGDKISDVPDLAFNVPAPDDFEAALIRVRGGVGVGQLTNLAVDLFGHTNTPQELISTVRNQISLLFENLESHK